MKRLGAIITALIFVVNLMAGCGGKASTPPTGAELAQAETKTTQTEPKHTATEAAPAKSEAQSADAKGKWDGGLVLPRIREAATKAGYITRDDYVKVFQNVAYGFSVQIVADNQDVVYPILQFRSVNDADAAAKEINAAGRSVAIRSGMLLTHYDVKNQGKLHAEILSSILSGNPIPKP